MPALLCLGTLGEMERCPAYHLVEQYKVTLPLSEARYSYFQTGAILDVRFSPSSSHLLFYGSCLSDSRILARDDPGQWAEEHLNWSDNSGSRIITGANFSACTNRLLTCSTQGYVTTLRPAHHSWDDVGTVTLANQTVKFSPSGKYMVSYRGYDPVNVWRMDENNDWLKMEVTGVIPGVFGEALFSPSERYLALRTMGKVTMLSLDDRGVWSAQQLTLISGRRESIDHASFSQVADQLLVCISGVSYGSGRVSIYSPEPSGRWKETVILPNFFLLDFSPAGKYLFTKCDPEGRLYSRYVLLWRRPEKLSDWSLNHCFLPEDVNDESIARLKSAIKLKHDSPVHMALFSPSDNHLLVSNFDGVGIWGKSQAGKWSIQTITREFPPSTTACFSLSGLHVLTCNSSMVGIQGFNDQKRWTLKGNIKQDGILKAYFNPLSEHEVVVLSRTTDGDVTNITLQVWEIRDAGKPD